MEKYTKLSDVREHYHTVHDLQTFLNENGFPHDIGTIRRWEKAGILPTPQRIDVKGHLWRVYDRNKNIFADILIVLNKTSRKRISLKK